MTALIDNRKADSLAQGLGLFSIGLGIVELLSARSMADGLGLRGQERLVQAYGLREIATGIGILASRGEDRAPWLWGRVAGDALDVATLAAGMRDPDPDRRRNAGLAMAAVLGVTMLDLVAAQTLQPERGYRMAHDYTQRSGFPRPPSEMRGAALGDNPVPREFRTPDALVPWVDARRPDGAVEGTGATAAAALR